jgi:O-antigen/teichoic acid export membrane protein
VANAASARAVDETAATAGPEHRSGPLASAALPCSPDPSVTTDAESEGPILEVVRSVSVEESNQQSEAAGRVARNFGALVGGQIVTWTMTLLWTLIVPRALGPVGFGILVSAQSVAGVLGIILGMATRQYLVRETVTSRGAGPKLVGTALMARLSVAPLVGVAAVVWTRVAHYGHDATTVLYLITAMTVLTLLTEPLQAAFQAMERMKYLAYADIVNKSAQTVIGIALVLVGIRVVGIAASMAIMAGVVFILTFWWLRPYFRIDMRTNPTLMARMTKQSMGFWVFGVFGMVYFWIDTIMLSLMTRSEVVGWYGATMSLFQTLMFLPVLVQTAWLPRLVGAFVKGRRDLARTARTPVELVLIISVPIATATALVAAPLIHAVYGPQFAPAVPVMIILAVCVPPIYMNIILGAILLAARRQRVCTITMVAAAFVNPLFNLVLIPLTERRFHNGAIGAAISLVLTEVLMDGVFALANRDVFDPRVFKRCALVCLASAGMGVMAYLTRALGTPISLAAGFVTLGILAVMLRILGRQELELAQSGLAHVRGQLAGRST